MALPNWNERCLLKSLSSDVLVRIEDAQDLEPCVKCNYCVPIVVLTGINDREVTNILVTSFHFFVLLVSIYTIRSIETPHIFSFSACFGLMWPS
jgi:hypothetical protein